MSLILGWYFLALAPLETAAPGLMFIRRRQVSPREEEIDCEGENTEEEDEVVETVC